MRKRYANPAGYELKSNLRSSIINFIISNLTGHRKDDAIPYQSQPDLDLIYSDQAAVTWLGHATFLIQIQGVNILTDPIWSKYLGFLRRSHPAPLAINRLPQIDYVLISHSHYDHLSFRDLKAIDAWKPVYLIPQGLASRFIFHGFDSSQLIERDWWQSLEGLGQLRMTFTPSVHWTRRTLFDQNTSHWGGWVVESPDQTIYFAGDTGYFYGFKQIADRFGPIDLALLPIGAYAPLESNSGEHTSPAQAVQAFIDLGASTFIPMHYGTYRLGSDTGLQCLAELGSAWQEEGLDPDRLAVLGVGASYLLNSIP